MSTAPREFITEPGVLDDIAIPAWFSQRRPSPEGAVSPTTPDRQKGQLMQTTVASALLAMSPGTPFQGGFFVGYFNSDGRTWGLVVSPKAEGQITGRWLDDNVDLPEAASCHDGLANTLAMTDRGSSLAKAILQFSFGGFDDWYIPSRDELELMYRHLKPTTQPNSWSFRDGDNASSHPAGYRYTPAEPAQTAAAAFQAGGEQAFDAGWYWSSTQCSRGGAFNQYFDNGIQYYSGKTYEGRARAVRRFIP